MKQRTVLLKSCFITWPGSQASHFLDHVEGFCAPQTRKNLPHDQMSAPQERGKQSQSDFREALNQGKGNTHI